MGNFVQRHAQVVSKLHNVHVLYAAESQEDLLVINEIEGVTEHLVYFKKRLPVLSYKKAISKAFKDLDQKFKFDLIHLNVTYPAALISNLFQCPYIITEHFSGFHTSSGHQWGVIRKKIAQKALNQAKCILPVSKHLGSAIQAFGVENTFEKVSNVVDTDIFFPSEDKLEVFTFLHVSSLEERSKNITGILNAFQKLDLLKVDFLLQIGGDGDMDELYRKIKASGINPNKVETFGESTPAEIAKKMQESHCLVMFSHFENQPCTILEALCTGIPIISSNVGGIPEEITTDNGILVEKGDDVELVKAFQKMINSYSNFKSNEISQRAKALYSNEAVAKKISDIYFNVLNINS